ncbi:MAG: phenylalanine--tRNA ligase subunit beta [candidate division Zixibacteria bacterium]|nr:phenylalanine--tRNA ligase subunit beta [candidate division Zixibacteria bacterium]
MKLSYKWLKELTGVQWSAQEMADRLTLCGTAVEEVESTAKYLDNIIVGEVISLSPIEGAKSIQKAVVNTGIAHVEVVCGAPNVAVGQKIPFAQIGAKVSGGLEIKKVTIRGVESSGMICSESELGISQDHAGIMVFDALAPLGTPVADYLDYDDYILHFELTPNRGDSMSALGIARDLAALSKVKVKRPEIALRPSAKKSSDYIKVSIEDSAACPRFTARVIRNLKIGQSPWWVKKKLLTAGIRPISNIVDVTNLVMLETGNPLHAFDLDKFGSNEVVVRRAKDGEELLTLDGKVRKLTPEVLLITNGKKSVAAAGVMGGFDSEVSATTTNLLLEVAYFNPSVIRKSRKQLELVSEASARFEKGVDPNGVTYASEWASYLFQELCGGEVCDGGVDTYPAAIFPLKISLRPKRCNAILGTQLSNERMAEILSLLEMQVEGNELLNVTVPTFRPDIIREIDLIEEIARIEGYAQIPDAKSNIGPLYTPTHRDDRFQDEIRHILTAAGFDEIVGHGLANAASAKAVCPALPQVKILNPVSEELNIVRNSLLTTTLEAVAHNYAHRNLDLRLFEIGKTYSPPINGTWTEEDKLCLAVSGEKSGNWREKPRPLDFHDITGALESLFGHFYFPLITFEPSKIDSLDPSCSFSVTLDSKAIGFIGQIKAELTKRYSIKGVVFAAELSIAPLMRAGRPLTEFAQLPIYPSAPRDLALIVDTSVKAADIVSTVKEAGGTIAQSVSIFDLYVGNQIQQGKKSVGVTIEYRSHERSLSGEEVDTAQASVIAALKAKFTAEIREK